MEDDFVESVGWSRIGVGGESGIGNCAHWIVSSGIKSYFEPVA